MKLPTTDPAVLKLSISLLGHTAESMYIYVSLVPLWQLKIRTVWSSMESTEQQTTRNLKYAVVPRSHHPNTLPFRFERRRLQAGLGSSVGCKVVARAK